MPRELGPERAHFGGSDGLITIDQKGKTSYVWKCIHCGWHLGGKNFQNMKARVHLSGDPSLRNGLINQVCTGAPAEIMEMFACLERCKRQEKEKKIATRKRQIELMAASPAPVKRAKQSRLPFARTVPDSTVDEAWAMAFYGLDLAANKIAHPLFREAIESTKRSSKTYVFPRYLLLSFFIIHSLRVCRYRAPSRQKLFGPLLDQIHMKCRSEQRQFLEASTGFGRALTGDSATIRGVKYLNYLVHDHGKGVMLVNVTDCTARLQEVGTVEATFIAHQMIKAIK